MPDVQSPDFPDITAAQEAYDAVYLPQVAARVAGVAPSFSTSDKVEVIDAVTGLPVSATVSQISSGGSGTMSSQNANNVAITGGTIRNLSALSAGPVPGNAYLIEVGQDWLDIAVDKSIMRIQSDVSRDAGGGSEFWGVTGIRVDLNDAEGVTDANDPYLVGVRTRVSLRADRDETGTDDVVGFMVTNKSYDDHGVTKTATEAFYVGQGADPVDNQEWNSAFSADTCADRAYLVTGGPYNYGLLVAATTTTAAIGIPNESKIVARNGANSSYLEIIRLDAGNQLVLGNGITNNKVVVGAPATTSTVATHFEVHGPGIADGATYVPHVRIVDTSSFAANVGGEIALGGSTTASVDYRTFAVIKSGKANGTSGNGAGYLSLASRNASTGLVEVMRLTELQDIQLADAVDIVINTTTGTKIGTATTQKIGFWNATPVVQPAGWGSPTGAATRTTFDTSSVTLPVLAEHVKAIIDDLKTLGIYGA